MGFGSFAKSVGGGMFDAILGPLKDIVNAIKDIVNIGNKIKEFFEYLWDLFRQAIQKIIYYSNPNNLVKLIVTILIFILLAIIVIIYRIPIGKLYLIEFAIIYPYLLIFYSIMMITFGIISVVSLYIIKYIDIKIFKGKLYPVVYRYFIACENEPSAWYKTGTYYDGNKNTRMIMAMKECDVHYKPDKLTGNFTCKRKLDSEPRFCPQSNIYRIYKNLPTITPLEPKKFSPDYNFLQKTSYGQKTFIDNYKKMKQDYYTQCNEKMGAFDNVTKNICRNYQEEGFSNNKLNNLCYNTYCRYGRREPFCNNLTKPEEITEDELKPETIFFKLIFISFNILVIGTILYLLLKSYLPK